MGGAALQEDQRFVDPKAKRRSWTEQLLGGVGNGEVKGTGKHGSSVVKG